MKEEESIREEVEKTLEAPKLIERVESNPYIYEKIIGRLSETGRRGETKGKSGGLIIAYAMLALLLIFNLYVLFRAQDRRMNGETNRQNVYTEISKEFDSTTYSYNY